MVSAHFCFQKIESFDVINQCVEVEVFQIRARRGRAARRIGPVRATVACLEVRNSLSKRLT
jgi:hypothetical protein